LWLIVRYFDGSVLAFAEEASLDRVVQLWPLPSVKAAAMLGAWITLQALLLLALPGRRQLGPVTPAGDRVAYKLNGVPALLVTVAAFCVASSMKWFSPTVVYDRFGEILMTCSLTGILGSFLL
jgi:7-dehydrocholesterol reductase